MTRRLHVPLNHRKAEALQVWCANIDDLQVTIKMSEAQQTTHFGEREVPLEEKQDLVNDVFHKVADRYDLMNDLMSGGMHRVWKDAFVANLAPPRAGNRPFEVLDMAGGTGDIAQRIKNASHGYAKVTVSDINTDMLRVGAERAKSWRYQDGVEFVEANAEELPFEDGRFDAYTISFGMRNVPQIDKALREAYRVLKRGGRLMVMEFSEVDVPVLDKVYDMFSEHVIPPIGGVVTGDEQPYQYLIESIRKFPKPKQFCTMIEDAGFSRVTHTPLSGNIAAIHSGWKLR